MKILKIALLILLIATPAFAVDDDDAATIWYVKGIEGGTANTLDGAISGTSIGPYDTAIASHPNGSAYIYRATFTTNLENSPYVIRPDDIAGGTTSWELVSFQVLNFYVGGTITGASDFTTTTGTITGRSKHHNLSSGTLETLITSGVSSIYISAVSAAARDPLSGVSVLIPSPPASGYDISFIMENDTAQAGTTTSVHFDASDTIATADTFIAGASKYVMSGTTDAQMIFMHSTGVSTWFVRTTGSPTVDAD